MRYRKLKTNIHRALLPLACVVAIVGCVARREVNPQSPMPSPCPLPTIVAPTPPSEMPGESEIDPYTGLHVTGRPRQIELESYRLQITGKVDRPLELTFDDLRCSGERVRLV